MTQPIHLPPLLVIKSAGGVDIPKVGFRITILIALSFVLSNKFAFERRIGDLVKFVIKENLNLELFAQITWTIWTRRNLLRASTRPFSVEQIIPDALSTFWPSFVQSPQNHQILCHGSPRELNGSPLLLPALKLTLMGLSLKMIIWLALE